MSGTIPWQELAESQRRLYWVKSGRVLYCKRCWADRTMERRQYRRVRFFFTDCLEAHLSS